jgi:hypothetical protein
MNIFALSLFIYKEGTTQSRSSVIYISKAVALLTTETNLEHAHERLLPRITRSWTLLLPSDTHRKHITDILLPFVVYLLNLIWFILVRHNSNIIEG